MTIAYLNGDYLPLDQAQVSALDRGFLFGDGVYELVPCYSGKLFRLSQHLRRLENSLREIRLDSAIDIPLWEQVADTLIQRNQQQTDGASTVAGKPDRVTDLSLYLQVTRGPSLTRTHQFPTEVHPTLFGYAVPMRCPSIDDLAQGWKAITVADTRWQGCHIKSTNLLPNVLARQQAADQHAIEAILVKDGQVLEGISSNVFIVENGTLITQPLSANILGGITRDVILELAEQHDIPHRLATLNEAQLQSADEIWVTSSSREIMPITQLNTHPVGSGQAGPMWYTMINLYQAFKQAL